MPVRDSTAGSSGRFCRRPGRLRARPPAGGRGAARRRHLSAGPARARRARAGAALAASLPANLAANPVLARWLDFGSAGQVTIRSGKVEYGQGIWTALAQVAAEELQVSLARVRVAPVSTSTSPDEGITSGSRSVQDSGSALRQACAQARDLLLAAAATRLEVSPAALSVADGEILLAGRPAGLSYWSLATAGTLDRPGGPPGGIAATG